MTSSEKILKFEINNILDSKYHKTLKKLIFSIYSMLESYGVPGDAKKWFVSYLSDRYQYCSLNGCRSTAKRVTCGIPQGSCLGLLLFIIYLNDFESCLQFSKANLYADDTETTISSSDIGDLIRSFQTQLDNISDWMRVNKLSVNPEKTEFMVIGQSSLNKQGCRFTSILSWKK